MSYIEENLATGESVLYTTKKHWVVLFWPVVIGVLCDLGGAAGIVFASMRLQKNSGGLQTAFVAGLILMLVGAGIIAYGVAKRSSTEIAVTDRRVLIKVGILRKRSLELFAPRIESVSVDQTLMGRMLNYGDIVVRGTGGTAESFTTIAAPLEFRRRLQQ